MRIERTASMRVAERVAAALRSGLKTWQRPDGMTNEATLYPYLNGREQGLILACYAEGVPAFIFAENRNSDDIVVYEDLEWSLLIGGGGAPSEAAYKARRFFRTPVRAAQHIAARLLACFAEVRRRAQKTVLTKADA